jgi:hypothetical protein
MKELLRTNDPVLLSWAKAVLADEGIVAFVFDRHASIVEGSIGAIQQRIMVADDELSKARRILEAARQGSPAGDL